MSRRLEAALRQEFARPVYAWRTGPGFIARLWSSLADMLRPIAHVLAPVLRWLGHIVARFMHWLGGLFRGHAGAAAAGSHSASWWVWLLLAVVVAGVLALLWRRSHRATAPALVPVEVVRLSPAELERATGDEQGADDWLELSRELQQAGEHRLALRAAFLGCLAALQREHWLRLRRDRTNAEYLREFRRALHLRGETRAAARGDGFARLVRIFDQAWYGGAAVSGESLARFLDVQREVVAE